MMVQVRDPAKIGARVNGYSIRKILIEGDGCIDMNIDELRRKDVVEPSKRPLCKEVKTDVKLSNGSRF